MSGTGHFDLFVSERAVERVYEFVRERYDATADETDYYVRIATENAVEEWCDNDPNAESEELARETIDILGGDDDEKTTPTLSNSSLASGSKTRFARDVRKGIEKMFNEDFEKRAPTSDTKGDYLSRILLEFVTNRRSKRLRREMKKVKTHARIKSGDADKVEQKVANIRSELADKFDNRHPVSEGALLDAVCLQPETKSKSTRENLSEKVLDAENYVESPTTPGIFMPRDEIEQNMENLGLPGLLDGPKYDRLQAGYEFSDLSKDDKIEGIKVALTRLAIDANGEYRLTAEKIKERVYGNVETVRVDTLRRYMNEILEDDAFSEETVRGAKAVRVSIPTLSKLARADLLKNANLAKKYRYEDAPDEGLVVNITDPMADDESAPRAETRSDTSTTSPADEDSEQDTRATEQEDATEEADEELDRLLSGATPANAD